MNEAAVLDNLYFTLCNLNVNKTVIVIHFSKLLVDLSSSSCA